MSFTVTKGRDTLCFLPILLHILSAILVLYMNFKMILIINTSLKKISDSQDNHVKTFSDKIFGWKVYAYKMKN